MCQQMLCRPLLCKQLLCLSLDTYRCNYNAVNCRSAIVVPALCPQFRCGSYLSWPPPAYSHLFQLGFPSPPKHSTNVVVMLCQPHRRDHLLGHPSLSSLLHHLPFPLLHLLHTSSILILAGLSIVAVAYPHTFLPWWASRGLPYLLSIDRPMVSQLQYHTTTSILRWAETSPLWLS